VQFYAAARRVSAREAVIEIPSYQLNLRGRRAWIWAVPACWGCVFRHSARPGVCPKGTKGDSPGQSRPEGRASAWVVYEIDAQAPTGRNLVPGCGGGCHPFRVGGFCRVVTQADACPLGRLWPGLSPCGPLGLQKGGVGSLFAQPLAGHEGLMEDPTSDKSGGIF
jgi:hypothetical protein